MLIDLNESPQCRDIRARILIIGAGAAGLILAREFADAGLDVALLESGGLAPDDAGRELSRGTCTVASPESQPICNDEYLLTSRERGVGGTLNLWGGKCGELDPVDFQERDWIAHSGWPFSKAELQPYLDRACYRFGIPTFTGRRRQLEAEGHWVRINDERNFTSALRVFSGVTGTAPGEGLHQFKADVTDDPSIRVYLRATVTEIACEPGGSKVACLHVAHPLNGRIEARADYYILAAGGLENARLLLLSKDACPNGLGNQHDLVGRFFAGHGVLRDINGPDQPPANLQLSDAAKKQLALYLHKDPAFPQALFMSTRGLQAREQTAGFAATLEPADDARCPDATPVFFALEQVPNPQSRVRLTDDTDALGCQRLHLDWQFTEQDLLTLQRSLKVLASDLQKAGVGTLRYQPSDLRLAEALEFARHHMGTTRMQDDPTLGVVNRDCRVHSVDNLFVAGASVFPTTGVANPTLTLAALAIRLADHLKQQLGKPSIEPAAAKAQLAEA